MRWRYLPFYLGFIFIFWLLWWRLFNLTIISGVDFRQLAEGNRIKEQVLRAPRGIIYDRHGQVLARNKPIYKYQVESSKYKAITREEALDIEAKGGSEAAKLQMDLIREYPYRQLLAHVTGYTGEVTDKEIRNSKFEIRNYQMGDWVGRTGIEEQYEDILRGQDGRELIEVDALGRKISQLGKVDSQPGKDFVSSIDLDLQKVAAQALGEKTGAILVSNPQTGEILALYSSPSFDPNNLEEKDLIDSSKPMINRAISGLYPPGSTFKIIVGASGLETGKITAQTQIEDTGEINIGPYKFPNWYWTQYGGKEGMVNVVKAYQRSNDIFFYKVGEWVGINKLEEWAGKFGVGKILGIDLPEEAAGVMPTPEWRKATLGTDWFLGDTYHLAIGQGDLEVTPLQVNFWTNVIANGGKLCQPRMLKINSQKDTSDLKTPREWQVYPERSRGNSPEVEKLGKACHDIGLKKDTVDLIKEGMKGACEPGGTGWPLFNFQVARETNGIKETKVIETACKTGTAEYGPSTGSGQAKTHAWFTVFAPVSREASAKWDDVDNSKIITGDPEISVTVLVEGGGEGSNVAGPIAKKILEEWFGR